ncbi:ABC transporter ATP-binding protein [Oryzomonas japonica]|uniref:ABC transporter ATP-binding protein n=1 Tax=Oryzomonas japonica TaxID=2603858 RepID=A0A7J4ZRW2_9BACT|nr:ABC transporter ATP-binding protein [Oryzomonas japonica]KAB0665715.1 ABC transporter ATP-binding protein [Oryzomonas japonica]
MPEDAAMTTLEFANVSFSYNPHGFMEQLSFAVAGGELVGLMGPNGAGKSTILKLAAGLLSPQQGEVLVGKRAIRSYGGNERAQLVAYLPQTLDTQVPFRVAELVGMGAYPRSGEAALTVGEALHLTGLGGKATAFLTELSGGEQRRAYIAMTLVQGARVLLLDEPLASLDIRYQFDLYRLLKDIARDKGVSVCLSLHDIGMGALLDRLLLLKRGRVVAEGDPGSVLTDEMVRDAFDLDDAADSYTAAHRAVGLALERQPR